MTEQEQHHHNQGTLARPPPGLVEPRPSRLRRNAGREGARSLRLALIARASAGPPPGLALRLALIARASTGHPYRIQSYSFYDQTVSRMIDIENHKSAFSSPVVDELLLYLDSISK